MQFNTYNFKKMSSIFLNLVMKRKSIKSVIMKVDAFLVNKSLTHQNNVNSFLNEELISCSDSLRCI